MALEADLLLDRRRLKRRLILWRTVSIGIAAVAVLIAVRGAGLAGGESGDRIARLPIAGIIVEDRKLVEAIRAAGRDKHVKALIVAIDSPGGTVAGGEALHRAIAYVAEKKPVVATMAGLGASAGYMVAMPTHRVFARESTVTGSIGVLMETGELSGLLAKLGIAADAIVSGPMKDQPSLTKPLTPAGRDMLQGIVQDMYDQFVAMVAAGRKMTPEAVRALADGRPYTGRQALKLGLIDAIGDDYDAKAWLEASKNVPSQLPVVDIATTGLAERMLTSQLSSALDGLWKTLISQRVMLDLPWAVWQR